MILQWRNDRSGAAAVEMALVLPVFLSLILGLVSVGTLGLAWNSLQYAAEEAARCAAVKTTVCTSSAATRSYALAHYVGPDVKATFTHGVAACGHQVTATGAFDLGLIPEFGRVPLKATACYPAA
jgi:Flp pilus assembly pilin Flp